MWLESLLPDEFLYRKGYLFPLIRNKGTKLKHQWPLIAGLLLPVCLSACADDETLIDQTGKVLFIALEGGVYGIQGNDGKNYDPVNLPPAFQKHDLLVRFTARERKDQVSFHQCGAIVEIIAIELR